LTPSPVAVTLAGVRRSFLAVVLVFAGCVPGRAQMAADEASPSDVVAAEAAPVAAAPAETPVTSPPKDDARHREALERLDGAAALFERGDARGALAEMQAVYEMLEGRPDRYVVLYNFGRIYEALHRYDRVTELHRRNIAESPPHGADPAIVLAFVTDWGSERPAQSARLRLGPGGFGVAF